MSFDKVVANNFYQDKGDQILSNWFLYEYANVLFNKISESSKLARYRNKHGKGGVAAFCVYFTKRLRKSIHDVQTGRTTGVVIDGRYVYEFYPDNSYAQTQSIMDAALAAWDEHIQICNNCPNQCLLNGYEITTMFDDINNV